MLRPAPHILVFFLILLDVAPSQVANAGGSWRQTPQPQAHAETRSIKARSGDTLRKIARRYGLPPAELVRLNNIGENTRLPKGAIVRAPVEVAAAASDAVPEVVGNRITLADGYSFEADEVWKDGDELWFRKGNISQRVLQQVSSVKPIVKNAQPAATNSTAQAANQSKPPSATTPPAVWIHLVGGARFRVDELQETTDGAWYTRGNLSIFMERDRIARIERELPGAVAVSTNRDWTSGSPMIDGLIKANAARYGLDPYLIFLVIEHESHFRQRAVSPKGARGLMQLMPGTASRLGVRDSFDPAQNIMGGSRYLKELMTMFDGRVDLVLASYNAGEGAVMKFGRAVPPYKETRNYVKRITKRYGQQEN